MGQFKPGAGFCSSPWGGGLLRVSQGEGAGRQGTAGCSLGVYCQFQALTGCLAKQNECQGKAAMMYLS